MFIRFALALTLGVLPLAAQSTSIQGQISDTQGGAIPDAIVTATNKNTSTGRKGLSNQAGSYSLLQLAPGLYTLSVEKTGFRTYTAEVTLQIDTPATLNIRLEVGQVTETVSVMAEAATINTETSSVGSPFTEKQIKELPLQTRNVVALLSIQAGVSPDGQVAGAKADQNNVTLDGADVNNYFSSNNGFNSSIPIPLDSVQEFKTTVAGVGADQGHSSGGQVSLVTKGGSNSFHGTLYEYNRNTYTAANSWSNNRAGIKRPALVRNQFGFSVGGPILKNKLLFFYNYEARKDRSGSSQTRVVPSDTFKQGIVKVALRDGRTVDLTLADVKKLDPAGLGANSWVLQEMAKYPSGNNPQAASDRGLNFNSLTFAAPSKVDNHTQVARLDYNIDSAGKHTLMARGTLQGDAQDASLSQFPGDAAASKNLQNARGLSVRYTAVLSPSLVNVLGYGYTRDGSSSTGNQIVLPNLGLAQFTATPRGSQRFAPNTNITDDVTWVRSRHTIQVGVNAHVVGRESKDFNNLPSYSFNRNTLGGLGNDITAAVTSYLQPIYGSTIALGNTANVINAFGALFGIVNSYSATYRYGIDGKIIPFGSPVTTKFRATEYEGYAQDVFKWKRNLTITYGLRYSIFNPPYEANGVQVEPTVPLSQFFADRVGAQDIGIPGFATPTAWITYRVSGPKNGGANYFPTDKNNFAPRLSIAYSPAGGTLEEKILGKGSAFRIGAGVIYDHYGTQMVGNLASGGSPGLASSVTQPENTNFTTGFRYMGSGYPALPTVQGGVFPFTPPLVTAGFGTLRTVSNDLSAPYQYVMNASYARPLPKNLTVEIGYIGRLSHSALVSQDFGQPLTKLKDAKSGQTLLQANQVAAQLNANGLTAAQVKTDPSLMPVQPFLENMFPALKDFYIPGSASANWYYDVYGNYAGSFLDGLHDVDRVRQTKLGGACISAPGCNTFFPLQSSGTLAYSSAGKAAYHGGTFVLRRAVSSGWGFDFNYTLGHSLDNGSGSESGISSLQDAFNPNGDRGPSSFDYRHMITADAVVELPFGKGKPIFRDAPGWLNQIIGGWQISTLANFRTGAPLGVGVGSVYNTNYLNSSRGMLKPGATMPEQKFQFQAGGIPAIFDKTDYAFNFVTSYPGTAGPRGLFRGMQAYNVDLAGSKSFRMPFEGHSLQLRGEAFNALNMVNWGNPSLTTTSASQFGQINSTSNTARVMQFALRYVF